MFFFHFSTPILAVKTQKNTEYFFNIEILCNIDDYCILLNFLCVWKFLKLTGIDLNLQFPAGWNEAKEIKYNNGFNKPAPRDFVGYGPLTAPESVALYNFTLMHNFRLIITYHTQGRIIFYKYQDKVPPQGREIGEEFSKISGYNLEDTPYESSFAGYKDWFINDFNKPGYTIEVGIGQNPVPISQFSGIYRENLGILVTGLTK